MASAEDAAPELRLPGIWGGKIGQSLGYMVRCPWLLSRETLVRYRVLVCGFQLSLVKLVYISMVSVEAG